MDVIQRFVCVGTRRQVPNTLNVRKGLKKLKEVKLNLQGGANLAAANLAAKREKKLI